MCTHYIHLSLSIYIYIYTDIYIYIYTQDYMIIYMYISIHLYLYLYIYMNSVHAQGLKAVKQCSKVYLEAGHRRVRREIFDMQGIPSTYARKSLEMIGDPLLINYTRGYCNTQRIPESCRYKGRPVRGDGVAQRGSARYTKRCAAWRGVVWCGTLCYDMTLLLVGNATWHFKSSVM